ncbi:unnamed protein product [Durusdinium trenchii]|uniref:RanBP2-type domain-containing protein n=1 Tax=Durusdinium trenchii TaxID=1381693 RepID=A0ABP0SNU1_9DINO
MVQDFKVLQCTKPCCNTGGLDSPHDGSVDGNWRCESCGNVNFPRRPRCNKCQVLRGPSGDAVVLQYAARVYVGGGQTTHRKLEEKENFHSK